MEVEEIAALNVTAGSSWKRSNERGDSSLGLLHAMLSLKCSLYIQHGEAYESGDTDLIEVSRD